MADKSRQKFNSFNEFVGAGAKPKAPEADLISVRVRATRLGYIGLELRPEGSVFTIQIKKGSKLPSWMEPVDGTSIEIAPIPETQETAHLRGDRPDESEQQRGPGDSDIVI